MACLHQINAAHKLPLCLRLAAPGDSLLLIESAVSLVAAPHSLESIPDQLQVFALEADAIARGLNQRTASSIELISDQRWVELSLEASRVCSW